MPNPRGEADLLVLTPCVGVGVCVCVYRRSDSTEGEQNRHLLCKGDDCVNRVSGETKQANGHDIERHNVQRTPFRRPGLWIMEPLCCCVVPFCLLFVCRVGPDGARGLHVPPPCFLSVNALSSSLS